MNRPIYFDNAATTYPKPQSVLMAANECMEDFCGNPGRGSHILAMRSAEKVFEARLMLAEMFGASPENVIFTLNTTYALNMAIKGVMQRGGHMLLSNMEHNSVLRPAERLRREGRIRYDIYKAYEKGKSLTSTDICREIIARLRRDTRLVCAIHSSNICSHTLPIREIGALCHRHGILFAVDGAQSAGHLPINMREDNIDILCLPAHKGLYGMQGVGIMILGDNISIDTLIEGGNGVNSLELTMGKDSPERYEGGTLCTPGIASLCAGMEFVNSVGLENIADYEAKLFRQAYKRLSCIENVEIYHDCEGAVLLFGIKGMYADRAGELLNEKGFCLRTGYHCSSLAHKALLTPDGGGVRIGFSLFNTEEQVDMLSSAIEDIARLA